MHRLPARPPSASRPVPSFHSLIQSSLKRTVLCLAAASCGIATAQVGGAYQVTNLVSDGSVTANFTDPNFLNPWGISASGTWWISTANSGFNYVVSSTSTPNPGSISFKVIIPAFSGLTTATGNPAGSVTTAGASGMLLPPPNSTKASFIFSTLDGTISAWNSKLGTANAICQIVINNSAAGASYPGLAIINPSATTSYILAANFGTGNAVEVYDSTFVKTKLTGTFTDPNLPATYGPYSIHVLNGQVFVAYAVRSAAAPYHSVSAPGSGIVSVFDLAGNFVARAVTGGQLNSPWGVAFAPTNFGIFGGSLLIGNFGDGHINAYDPKTYAFRGQLNDSTGKPLTYATMWDLLAGGTAVGNTTAVSGGDTSSVYFTAGLTSQLHGLFGVISNNASSTATPTFGISASTNAVGTVDGGTTSSAIISIAPTNKFSGAVSFSCSGLPASATCNFTPSQVTATATAPVSTSLTISTVRTSMLVQPHSPQPHSRRTEAAGIVVALLLPFAFYRRRSPYGASPLRLLSLFAIALVTLGAITSCSSNSTLTVTPTPTGTSTVTVTATSGTVAQSTTVSLVVQ